MAGRSNVGNSIFAIFLTLFLLVSTASTFFVAARMRDEALANGMRVAEVSSQSYEQNLSQSMVLLDTTLSSLVLNLNESQAFNFNASRLSTYLSNTVYFTPQLSSLSLLDSTGRVLASTNIFQVDALLDMEELRPPPHQNLIHFSRPWLGTDFVSGRPITGQTPLPADAPILIPMSRTVKNKSGEFLLLGTLNPAFFVGDNSDLARKSGQLGIFHRDGFLLMTASASHRYVGRRNEAPSIKAALEADKASVFTFKAKDEGEFIVAMAPSAYARLVVGVFLSTADVLEVPQREARRFIFLALSSIVLISLLASAIYWREQRRTREQQLAREQELQRQKDLLNALPAAVAMIGPNGQVAMPNAGWHSLASKWVPVLQREEPGPYPAQWLQEDYKHFIPPHLLERFTPVLQSKEASFEVEWPYMTPQGKEHWFAFALRAVPSLNTLNSVMMITDITERKEAESQALLAKQVFETSAEGIIVTDTHNLIVSANPAALKITGYDLEDLLGHTPAMLSSGSHQGGYFDGLWHSVVETGSWQGEMINRHKNGALYSLWMTISAIRNAQGTIVNYAGIFTDISERKATEEKIRYLSEHDPLTGLPNRTLFQKLLAQAIARSQRNGIGFSLLFIDLDRFKVINDTLGHIVGDRLLQSVAERIRACLRTTDALCRQGGDEFLVLLDGVEHANDAAHVAEKLLEQVGKAHLIDSHELRTTPSIGIALYPKDGKDPTDLIKSADMAMYQSKDRGRNTYHFHTQEMDAQAAEMLSLERGLRNALDRQELCLHYQPLVDIASGRIVGAEALMRWHSQELGVVSPARFIPVAENSGLIVTLGHWALRQACAQAQYWREIGFPDFKIAVNVSAIQMEQSSYFDSVQEVLAETGFPPHLLELEVTESLLVDFSTNDSRLFDLLRERGIGLAIDDFGTGYSSLAYLRRLPLDKLKIDKSFVHDITSDPEDANIIKAIIGMARSLDLLVLAEGVETEAQLNFLREHGCDHIQGYLFSPPLAPAPFEALLRSKA